MTTGKTIALTRQTFVGKVMSLLFNTLSRLVIAFLPGSKCLLISWLQSPSAVILEPKKIKSGEKKKENKFCHCFHCCPKHLCRFTISPNRYRIPAYPCSCQLFSVSLWCEMMSHYCFNLHPLTRSEFRYIYIYMYIFNNYCQHGLPLLCVAFFYHLTHFFVGCFSYLNLCIEVLYIF